MTMIYEASTYVETTMWDETDGVNSSALFSTLMGAERWLSAEMKRLSGVYNAEWAESEDGHVLRIDEHRTLYTCVATHMLDVTHEEQMRSIEERVRKSLGTLRESIGV